MASTKSRINIKIIILTVLALIEIIYFVNCVSRNTKQQEDSKNTNFNTINNATTSSTTNIKTKNNLTNSNELDNKLNLILTVDKKEERKKLKESIEDIVYRFSYIAGIDNENLKWAISKDFMEKNNKIYYCDRLSSNKKEISKENRIKLKENAISKLSYWIYTEVESSLYKHIIRINEEKIRNKMEKLIEISTANKLEGINTDEAVITQIVREGEEIQNNYIHIVAISIDMKQVNSIRENLKNKTPEETINDIIKTETKQIEEIKKEAIINTNNEIVEKVNQNDKNTDYRIKCPCRENKYYDNGELHSCILEKDYQVIVDEKEYTAKAKSHISFYKSSKISSFSLAKDTQLEINGQIYIAKARSYIYFYESEKIKSFYIVKDTNIQGKSYKAWEYACFDEYGNVKDCNEPKKIIKEKKEYNQKLKHNYKNIDYRINCPCTEDSEVFNDNGKLENCTLSQDYDIIINNQKFIAKKGEKIYFHKNGKIYSFAPIQDIEIIINRNKYIAKAENYIHFHESGMIFSFAPVQDIKIIINNNKYIAKAGMNISFYENGKIYSFAPIQDIKIIINNNKYIAKAGMNISFYENGKISSFYLVKDTKIKAYGKKYLAKAETDIKFNINGKISSFYFAKDTKIKAYGKNYIAKKGKIIDFRESGKIISFVPLQDIEILINSNKFVTKAGSTISFYENGKIRYFNLAKDTKIKAYGKNYTAKATRYFFGCISFYRNGKIQSFYLANDAKIQGKLFKAGQMICFNKYGKIIYYR